MCPSSHYVRFTPTFRAIPQAWEAPASENILSLTPPTLHNEGRAVRITIQKTSNLGLLAALAQSLVFDYVHYADRNYIYLSVIPDECRTKVDLLFLLDGSGSMEQSGYDLERQFFKEVLKYFDIATDESRVASISYASSTRPDFTFDEHTSKAQVNAAIDRLVYNTGPTYSMTGNTHYCITRRGICGTGTRDAINQARNFYGTTAYGARPKTAGVPRVAVVLTDGTCGRLSFCIV